MSFGSFPSRQETINMLLNMMMMLIIIITTMIIMILIMIIIIIVTDIIIFIVTVDIIDEPIRVISIQNILITFEDKL